MPHLPAEEASRLPRTRYQQVDVGAPVYGLAQLRPGDLLFISGADGTPQAPGHVGMYTGDILLIQAPKTGDLVRISPLSRWTGSITARPTPVLSARPAGLVLSALAFARRVFHSSW